MILCTSATSVSCSTGTSEAISSLIAWPTFQSSSMRWHTVTQQTLAQWAHCRERNGIWYSWHLSSSDCSTSMKSHRHSRESRTCSQTSFSCTNTCSTTYSLGPWQAPNSSSRCTCSPVDGSKSSTSNYRKAWRLLTLKRIHGVVIISRLFTWWLRR